MAFKNPPRSITWPPGARTNEARIVVGADLPDELQDDIVAAVLFYVVDPVSNLEQGYFFIANSNTNVEFNQPSLIYGQVQYPTPGDPSSATSADVKGNKYSIMHDNLVPLDRFFNVHISDIGGFFLQDGARFGSIDSTFGTSDVDVFEITQDLVGGIARLSPDAFLSFPSTSRGLFLANTMSVIQSGLITGDETTTFDWDGVFMPSATKFKTSEPTNNTAVLANDAQLFFDFPSIGEYMVEGVIYFSTPVGANFKYTFVTDDPSNDAFRWISSAAAPTQQMFFNTEVQNVARTNSFQGFTVHGRYKNLVNPGGINLQWAQQTLTAGNTQVLGGSRLTYRRVS